MKQLLILSLAVLSFTACGNRNGKKTADSAQTETTVQAADPSNVYVYYFHGKQRCKTCIAVGNVSEKAVKDMFAECEVYRGADRRRGQRRAGRKVRGNVERAYNC